MTHKTEGKLKNITWSDLKVQVPYLKELQTNYQNYADKLYKPHSLFSEVVRVYYKDFSCPDDLAIIWSLFEIIYEYDAPRVEFLVHRECFHPTLDMWYQCGYTSSIEVALFVEYIIKEIESV